LSPLVIVLNKSIIYWQILSIATWHFSFNFTCLDCRKTQTHSFEQGKSWIANNLIEKIAFSSHIQYSNKLTYSIYFAWVFLEIRILNDSMALFSDLSGEILQFFPCFGDSVLGHSLWVHSGFIKSNQLILISDHNRIHAGKL
jgi:hypothetical protein